MWRISTAALSVITLLLGLVAPASARSLLSTDVTVTQASKRSCLARSLSPAAGTASRAVRAPSFGRVQARLKAATGDWDLAVLDARTGRTVAGSTHFGARELAEGFVNARQRLVVRACRRAGRASTARVSLSFDAIRTGKRVPAQLVGVATRTRAAAEKLRRLGLDITEHGERGELDVVLHSQGDAQKLRTAGFRYRVKVADLAEQGLRDRRSEAAYAQTVRASALPSGRTSYRRLPDYTNEMKFLAAANRDIVKPITLPFQSYEGRPVEGLEITTNPNARDGKPVFLQLGVHHAREWPSGEHAIEWAFELIRGYRAGDARIRRLVETTRTIVIPIVNPDGFNASREAGELQGGGGGRGGDETLNIVSHPNEYRRKNCRLADDSPAGNCAQPAFGLASGGVDPNRNYGAFWGGPGASPDRTNETYHGPGPFSEPETRNIRALVSARHVTTLITNHTFSNLVLRPPGIASQGPAPDETIYKALGDAMAAENGYSSQFGFQLYDTTGTTEDWSHYSTGGLGFTFEIGPQNFHPPYQEVVAEYDGTTTTAGAGGGNREAYFKALENTADSSKHSVIGGRAPAGAVLRLQKTFETPTSRRNPDGSFQTFTDQLNTSLVVPSSGIFDWHINPSTRPLVAQTRGRAASGPPSPTVTFSGGTTGATPCADADTEDPTCFNDHAFTVPANGPGVDNAKATVRIEWLTPTSDWDMKVFRDTNGDGSSVGETQVLGTSAQGPTDFEQVTIGEPQLTAGRYVIRVVNFAATEPYDGTVDFWGPDPPQTARTESWALVCESPEGTPRTFQAITIARGGRRLLNLDDACASPVLGKTTIGSNVNVMTIETKRANRFGLSSSVRATRLRAYLDGRGRATGSQNVRGVVYADAGGTPGALLRSTATVTINAGRTPGWVDFAFSSPLTLAPGNYWLGTHSGASQQVARFYWDPVPSSRRFNLDAFADGSSDPFFGSSVDNQQMSTHLVGVPAN